jgi:hypothetical protein
MIGLSLCLLFILLLLMGMSVKLKDINKVTVQGPEGAGFWRPGAFQGYEIRQSSLLLGSRLTECETATVRYMVWMKELENSQDLFRALELFNLPWNMETLTNGWGERAVCLWAQERVNAAEEKKVPEKLQGIQERVYQRGWENNAVIYFEESVDEAIDLQAYWDKENIVICQKSSDGAVESWSGFDPKGFRASLCGSQLINIQLTTRQGAGGGKTILAFPTLYNDI